MKFKLNKAEYDGLSDDLKKEYKLDGEEATLIVEGGEDVGALKRAKDHEKEARKKAEDRLAEAEKREDKLKKDLANAGGDAEKIKEIEAKHATEMDKLRNERQAEADKYTAERNGRMVSEEAQKIADKFTVPGVMAGPIAARLKVEEVGGVSVVRVVDVDGGPTSKSISDLEKEFIDNKEYSSIIKANVGSGGGATNPQGGGATDKKLSEMTLTEQAKLANENPEAYQAAVEAEKA